MNPTADASTQNIEKEMDILLARIEEKMGQIRRDREEGEALTAQTREISRSNTLQLEELRQALARMI